MPIQLVEFDPLAALSTLDHKVVLFLDIEGVLHPEGCSTVREFELAQPLADALDVVDPAGVMPVVISSGWRFLEDLAVLLLRLPADLRRRVIGVTPSQDMDAWLHDMSGDFDVEALQCTRQAEIETWMRRHAPAALWVAIDDRADLFRANVGGRLVVCDKRLGCDMPARLRMGEAVRAAQANHARDGRIAASH